MNEQVSTTVSLINPEMGSVTRTSSPLSNFENKDLRYRPDDTPPNVGKYRIDEARPLDYHRPLPNRDGNESHFSPRGTGRPSRDTEWSPRHYTHGGEKFEKFRVEMHKEMDRLVKDAGHYYCREIGSGRHRMVVLLESFTGDAEVVDTIAGQDDPVRMHIYPVATEQGWAMIKMPNPEDVKDQENAARYAAMNEAVLCIVNSTTPTDKGRIDRLAMLTTTLGEDASVLEGINEPYMWGNGKGIYREPGFYNFTTGKEDLQGAMAVSLGAHFYLGADRDTKHSFVVGMPPEITKIALEKMKSIKQLREERRSPIKRLALTFKNGVAALTGALQSDKV